jgi:CRISPR/Cas system-associated exonuclease Cas4 (RecB family)
MNLSDFYTITKPVEWAKSPSAFSYSSLQAINICPLQWQLLHSKYGTELLKFPARPSPAAVEGNIIHYVLEKLFRALSLRGLPTIGSSAFSECISHVNIKEKVSSYISLHEKDIAKHPRGNGFKLRSSAQQLVNKIIRLFRQQYSDLPSSSNNLLPVLQKELNDSIIYKNNNPALLLKKYGALSEFKIKHPTIPFMGIIDFIFMEQDQPVIVDFKTGNQNKDHLKQAKIYATLWWRQAGQISKRLEIRYPQIVSSFQIDKSMLVEAEKQLNIEIKDAIAELSSKPAKALQGKQCAFCDVHQFCDEFWKRKDLKLKKDDTQAKFVDIELTVNGVPTQYGFEGKTINNEEVIVVFSENTSKLHANVQDGQNIRILSVLARGKELIVKPRTEIYHFRL